MARYADSDGYEKDLPRPYAWRWRDWVINAINRDMPFDQFTIEQLAGDLLPSATVDQRIATGFHRNTLTNCEGGVDQEEYRIKAVKDRVYTTGTVWLGLTAQCGECHSHKFDPFSQREYYELAAFFNNADESDLPAPLPGETEAYQIARGEFDRKQAELKGALAAVEQTSDQADGAELAKLKKAVEDHAKKEPKPPGSKARAFAEHAEPRANYVHERGDFRRPGQTVQPGTLGMLHPFKPRGEQPDLFDPKPTLNELDGEKLPESFTKDVQFAFIQKETARAMASPRKFAPHGESGVEFSDLLPNIGSCADDICMIRSLHTDVFNHHPAQLMMETGVPFFGRPSVGSWLLYGLGSESQNLPGYVVLTSGRGTSGGTTLWSSGFLPSTYAGVLFRNKGEPVLNLTNPPGTSTEIQRVSLDALRDLNGHRYEQIADQEIASRIASYELAFRMQSAAPELIDLSDETQETLDAYGVDRTEGDAKGDGRGGGSGVFDSFSRNCLLARRLVERGVRYVPIFHASWDHHSKLDEGLSHNCRMADQPIAALIKDLKQRGLLDSTLIVWVGEFGRTPLGENRKGYKTVTGRDHHPFAFSTWLAGGGVKGGQVVGRRDDFGWNIAEDPVHINDFHATLLRLFGFNHKKLTFPFAGLDVRLTNVAGNVVEKILA